MCNIVQQAIYCMSASQLDPEREAGGGEVARHARVRRELVPLQERLELERVVLRDARDVEEREVERDDAVQVRVDADVVARLRAAAEDEAEAPPRGGIEAHAEHRREVGDELLLRSRSDVAAPVDGEVD